MSVEVVYKFILRTRKVERRGIPALTWCVESEGSQDLTREYQLRDGIWCNDRDSIILPFILVKSLSFYSTIYEC